MFPPPAVQYAAHRLFRREALRTADDSACVVPYEVDNRVFPETKAARRYATVEVRALGGATPVVGVVDVGVE
jgi:hypothetical protein